VLGVQTARCQHGHHIDRVAPRLHHVRHVVEAVDTEPLRDRRGPRQLDVARGDEAGPRDGAGTKQVRVTLRDASAPEDGEPEPPLVIGHR
jgi:hypothetical protein